MLFPLKFLRRYQGLLIILLSAFSPPILAAPYGITPGLTSFSEAKNTLGEPTETLIEGARYRFSLPADSEYQKLELYFGRESNILEIAEFFYDTPKKYESLARTFGKPAISYPLLSGDTREVFLETRISLLREKEGSVRSIAYLSSTSLLVILSEIAPLSVNRSTPENALMAFVAALTTGKFTDLQAATGDFQSASELQTLLKRRKTLLLLFDGFSSKIPNSRGKKEIVIEVRQALFGTAQLVFRKKDTNWFLAKISPQKDTQNPSSPRAAFDAWRENLLLGGTLETTTVEAKLGPSWREQLPTLELIGGVIFESNSKESVLVVANETVTVKLQLIQDGKSWKVAGIVGEEK